METMCIDDLTHAKSSLLDGLKSQQGAHFNAPPTMNGRVRLYKTAPKLHFPILFLHVATTIANELSSILENIRPGAVVFGLRESVAILLTEMREYKAQPLYYHDDHVVVRIA